MYVENKIGTSTALERCEWNSIAYMSTKTILSIIIQVFKVCLKMTCMFVFSATTVIVFTIVGKVTQYRGLSLFLSCSFFFVFLQNVDGADLMMATVFGHCLLLVAVTNTFLTLATINTFGAQQCESFAIRHMVHSEHIGWGIHAAIGFPLL